jgi:multiple sugar transport system substrate-binding protein
MAEVTLKVLCWDHPRCVTPVKAAARAWEQTHPQVTFSFAARPLAAFNDQPITEVAATADLLFIDHPMVGRVAQEQALLPLQDLLEETTLAELAADSVGGSHESYLWEGGQWATAVDAACQVAVVDQSRVDRLGEVPCRWEDVLESARVRPGAVAIPLYPSDAVLSLLSISADLQESGSAGEGLWSREAVEVLSELVRWVDPRSYDLNPPRLLDLMSTGDPDDVPVYAPLLFGYTNYQRPTGPGRRLSFCSPPSYGERPAAVLGGAGLAVSAFCDHPAEAASFAAWMAGAEAQGAIVLPNEGQPASRTVWQDPAADALVGGFFSGTRTTIESSYLRPRESWWPGYQEAAGIHLVQTLRAGTEPGRIHDDLQDLLTGARNKEVAR